MSGELVDLGAKRVNVEAVEHLEEALKLARAGDVTAVGIARVHRDGAMSTAWSSSHGVASLLGAVTRLASRICAALDEQ